MPSTSKKAMRTKRDGIEKLADELTSGEHWWREHKMHRTARQLVVTLLRRRDAYWRRRVRRIIKAQRRIYVARQASARARDNSVAEAYWAHKALAADDLLAALKETP